ncbi:MAG: hypothetical protein C0618_03395 [Desulfuromonas sp.]|nr:MAG: hypothetical protein C0618_03395 [Desulfuromonas sp.]
MSKTQRHTRIINLLASSGTLSVQHLAQQLGTSRMTIHRDLKQLDQEGQLRRFHGGAIALNCASPQQSTPLCPHCLSAPLPHQSCQAASGPYTGNRFCCPTCWLGGLCSDPTPPYGTVTDLISSRTLSAADATFLINSSAAPCCEPSILTFLQESDAIAFRAGFGGVLGRLADAIEFLRIAQRLTSPRKSS